MMKENTNEKRVTVPKHLKYLFGTRRTIRKEAVSEIGSILGRYGDLSSLFDDEVLGWPAIRRARGDGPDGSPGCLDEGDEDDAAFSSKTVAALAKRIEALASQVNALYTKLRSLELDDLPRHVLSTEPLVEQLLIGVMLEIASTHQRLTSDLAALNTDVESQMGEDRDGWKAELDGLDLVEITHNALDWAFSIRHRLSTVVAALLLAEKLDLDEVQRGVRPTTTNSRRTPRSRTTRRAVPMATTEVDWQPIHATGPAEGGEPN